MLWAAFAIAFYGFLRVNELVGLHRSDISFSSDHISIILHQSKTDPSDVAARLKSLAPALQLAHTTPLTATVN